MYVLEDICQGKHSPVLPVRVTGENGETFESRTRIAFIRRDDGQADVVFYPVLKSSRWRNTARRSRNSYSTARLSSWM